MIRWKRKKAKYPDEKSAQRMKKLLEKTTYTSENCLRVFVSKSEFFCSCQLLAQNWILNIALEWKNTLREFMGRVAIGNGFNL